MKITVLCPKDIHGELLGEFAKILSAGGKNSINQYTLEQFNLTRIQFSGADLVVTVNLYGFEFTTLTGGISYNLWNTKFVHFLLDENLPDEKYLAHPLSISMFFFCKGTGYQKYLQKRYPLSPYLEAITGWREDAGEKAVKENAACLAALVWKAAEKCGLSLRLLPELEAECYFRQLEEEWPKVEEACRYINGRMREALADGDDRKLLSLIPYMESGKGKRAWKYVGGVRKILRVLQTISLETKYRMIPFHSGCGSKEELMEKYQVMVFALRRLENRLSEESVAEAKRFLKGAGISPFAVYLALQNELFLDKAQKHGKLAEVFVDTWTEGEKLLFAQLTDMERKG